MPREFAGGFYKSPAWQRSRASYIASRRTIDGGMCEICRERPGVIVHHKIHLTADNIKDSDISLSHSNLQFVCHYCHDIIHGNAQRKVEGLTSLRFDENGQPVPVGSADAPR